MKRRDTHSLPTLPSSLVAVHGTNPLPSDKGGKQSPLQHQNHEGLGESVLDQPKLPGQRKAHLEGQSLRLSSRLLVHVGPVQCLLDPSSGVFHQLTNAHSKLWWQFSPHCKLHQLNPLGSFFFFFSYHHNNPLHTQNNALFWLFYFLTHALLNSPMSLSWLDKSWRTHQSISVRNPDKVFQILLNV